MTIRSIIALVVAALPLGCTLATGDEGDAVESETAAVDATPCTPGLVETRYKGAQSRVCTSKATWTEWGSCPLSVATGAPIPPPYGDAVVFVTPHADDESLGMAGAVRDALSAGRPVYIELMTHGGGSSVCKKLGLDFTACGDARVREFMDAAARLGVTGVFVNEFDRDPATSAPRSLTKADVASRIRYWLWRSSKQLALRGTAGDDDASPKYSTTTERRTHPEHRAVFEALRDAGASDKKAYFVYHHGHYDESDVQCPVAGTDPVQYGSCPAAIPTLFEDIAVACDAKRDALDAYAVHDPAAGRFAIGATSVPELMAGASADCHEYAVVP